MTNLTKDLADVVKACAYADGHAPLSDTELDLRLFIRTHHTAIQQNAEAALRLMALERAIADSDAACAKIDVPNVSCWIRWRADELLREWKEKGDE
jgi:hypothetical protein